MKLVTNFLPSFLFLLTEQGHFLAFPAHFSTFPFWAVQFSSLFLLISPLHLFKQYNSVLSSCPFSFYLNSSSKSFCPFLLIFMFLSFKQDIQACSYCSLGKIVISRRKSFLKSFEFYYPNRLGAFKFQIQTVFVLIKPVGRHIIRIFISRYLVSALYII